VSLDAETLAWTEDFKLRLREAQIWCKRASATASRCGLWSEELEPYLEAAYAEVASERREQALSYVVETRRAALLRGHDDLPDTNGRLLFSHYEECTFSGESELESNGLFDTGDIPAWDLWIDLDLLRHGMYCWIPSQLVPLAEKAIEASFISNIYWADELTHPGAEALLEAGVLDRIGVPPAPRWGSRNGALLERNGLFERLKTLLRR